VGFSADQLRKMLNHTAFPGPASALIDTSVIRRTKERPYMPSSHPAKALHDPDDHRNRFG